jgi:hypothetical protein
MRVLLKAVRDQSGSYVCQLRALCVKALVGWVWRGR